MPNLWQLSAMPARVCEHLAVLLARIGLAGDRKALREAEPPGEPAVELAHLGAVAAGKG